MTPQEQAKELLQRMPIGNARIFCRNKIVAGGNANDYWERVEGFLENELQELKLKQ